MMKASNIRCLEPEHVRHFVCDGKACGAQCCRGWSVVFDAASCQKYEALPEDMRRHILERLLPEENPAPGRSVDFHGATDCPFLERDRLCWIQKNCGESYLSDVCATYPRVYRRIGSGDDAVMERSLVLSCPMAANLALLPKEPMRFHEAGAGDGRESAVQNVSISWLDGTAFLALQRKCIAILQDRKQPMDQRLLRLGQICRRLDRMQDSAERVMEFLQGEDGCCMEGKREQMFLPVLLVRWIAGLMEHLYAQDRENALPPLYLFDALRAAYIPEDDASAAAVAAHYEEARARHGALLLQKHGHLLENYLVQAFWLEAYPCRFAGSFYDNFLAFASLGKMIEFCLLALMEVRQQNLSEQEAVLVIRLIAQQDEHNHFFKGWLWQYVREHSAGFGK